MCVLEYAFSDITIVIITGYWVVSPSDRYIQIHEEKIDWFIDNTTSTPTLSINDD